MSSSDGTQHSCAAVVLGDFCQGSPQMIATCDQETRLWPHSLRPLTVVCETRRQHNSFTTGICKAKVRHGLC